MYCIARNSILSFFVFIFFISCQRNYNKNQIKLIKELETINFSDNIKLNAVDTIRLKNNTKIANFNLLKLEEKELDSISVELIYFEYIEYLQYVNQILFVLDELKDLKNRLIMNQQQLHNIKLDYQNSKSRRIELDQHLQNEQYFTFKTSEDVDKVCKMIFNLTEQFDSLNTNFELIIDEN